MGRKQLPAADKKVRLDVWKSPREIKIVGGENSLKKSKKAVQLFLSSAFDEQLGILNLKK